MGSSAKWLLLAVAPVVADTWTSQLLPGEGDIAPASVPTWEDSVLADRSTARYAVRATPSSSRRSLSYMGSPSDSLFLELQRSDPGGPRRRILSWNSDALCVRAGDLDAWAEDPLVEGTARSSNPGAPSEAFGWMQGSGLYPNGVDAHSGDNMLGIRGRWRSDRCEGRRSEGAGAVHLGIGPVQLSARSEDGPVGSDRIGSTGLDWSRLRLRAAANDHGSPALWAGLDSSDGIWHCRGSARWISKGFRHGGIPANWPGSASVDATLAAKFAAGVGATWRTQALLDSLHGTDLRTGIQARSRPIPGLQLRMEGLVDRHRDVTWGSSRLGLGGSNGTLRPWVEQSWSDSVGTPDLTTSVGVRWVPGGHLLRAELLWKWNGRPAVLVSHEGRIPAGDWNMGFRIEGSSDLLNGNALRGQGILTCAW